MDKKSNIFTISKETGYSITTVSRVLTGQAARYRISNAAVEKITEAAHRFNYRPNIVAQTLRTQKSHTIGLLVPGIDNPFFATLSGIVINMLAARGYHTLLADSRESEAEEELALQTFISRKVDGIISIPVSTSAALHEQISKEIPLVLIDRYFSKTTLPYVCTDNYAGARMATEFLIERGYKHILAIQGVPTSMPNQERLRGFMDALEGILAAFPEGARPYDAVFAFSSTILLGVIDALRTIKLRVGTDVGVISFDNNGFLDFLDPAVTRIEQPLRESVEIAVETLFDIMSARRAGEPEPEVRQQLILPTLVVRASC